MEAGAGEDAVGMVRNEWPGPWSLVPEAGSLYLNLHGSPGTQFWSNTSELFRVSSKTIEALTWRQLWKGRAFKPWTERAAIFSQYL